MQGYPLRMSEARIFLDTNSFIQLRDLADLPFGALVPDASVIILLVSPTVIDELDVAKNGTNRRKRDRARAALRLIDQASIAEGFRLPLSERQGVSVSLELADDAAPDWSRIPKLDQSRPDDRLVAETLTHGRDATLLSHDSGPRIRARLAGIVALAPPDEWLLPAEQTDDQRKITSLERDLREARTAKPQLDLRVRDAGDGQLLLPRFRLPSLRDSQVAWLTSRLLQETPEARLEVGPSGDTVSGLMALYASSRTYFSEREVVDYQRSYRDFAGRVREYFRKLHDKLADRSRLFDICIDIENIGSISAGNLTFSARLDSDCFSFAAKRSEGEDHTGGVETPKPPKVPRSDRRGDVWDASRLAALNAPQHRDPTEFYWLKKPRIGDLAMSQSCADFRPERRHDMPVWIYTLEQYAARSRLSLQVSAENFAALERVVDVRSEVVHSHWGDGAVLRLLPDVVAHLIRRMPDN